MLRQLPVAFLMLAAIAQAGFLKMWQLKETAAAPVLVVGKILSVQKGERVPDGTLAWKDETIAMTADVQVLRRYGSATDRIVVHFLAFGPSVTGFVCCSPPPLPRIEAGETVILPLKQDGTLMAESGVDVTIPAHAEMDVSEPAASARAFLDREIINTLTHGTPRERSDIARYITNQHDNLTGEWLPLLNAEIGEHTQGWVDAVTNLIASQGIPRPSVTELLQGKIMPIPLTQAALQNVKPVSGLDAMLIKAWIAQAPWHAWGSAGALLEFGDDPVTTSTLREALRNDVEGSSYIAWTLVRNGHRATLPDALERALKVADRPQATDLTDLQGAAALLRDYGSDRQLDQLAALVRKYQTADRKFYNSLWQYAAEDSNPRETRVLKVVLHDRETLYPGMRVCDFAVGVLERAVGQSFGSGAKTIEDRDAALVRALAWIQAN